MMVSPQSILLALALLCATVTNVSASSSNNGCFDSSHPFSRNDWQFCQPINARSEDGQELYVYHTPLPESQSMMLGLHVTKNAFGWSSLAFAGNGGMKGSSQIVVRTMADDDDSSAWIVEDRYSSDYTTPELDDSQDVTLLFADQNDHGTTSWGVLLPLDSCDDRDYPIRDIYRYMSWALGDTHEFYFHGTRRGTFHINLMRDSLLHGSGEEGLNFIPPSDAAAASKSTSSSTSISTNKEEPIETIVVKMPDVPVVAAEDAEDASNVYTCTYFDLQQLAKESTGSLEPGDVVHATKFEPLIDQDTAQYVHHMLLYECDETQMRPHHELHVDPEHLRVVPNCVSMVPGCYGLKYAMAVGADAVTLPKDVGLPVGEGSRWLMLQMHYYNPSLDTGLRDSSGVRVHYTTQMRPQEASVMQLNGGTHGYMRTTPLPGKTKDVALDPFIMPAECTQNMWNETLNIIGVGHHMHKMGTQMTIDVVRDGVNLGPLREEKVYDYNHQSLEPSHLSLEPSDEVFVSCHYDTSSSEGDKVSFGDFTQQEMCYAVVMYWPRQLEDYYQIMLPRKSAEECLTYGTGEYSHVSQCAQQWMESIPGYYGFVEESPIGDFDASFMCNGGFYEAMLRPMLGNVCPDSECHKSANCTQEELTDWAQNRICRRPCTNQLGLAEYPVADPSNVTVNVDIGVWGCKRNPNDWHDLDPIWFKSKEEPAMPACQPRGDLGQNITLEQTTIPSSSGSASGSFLVLVSLVVSSTFLALL